MLKKWKRWKAKNRKDLRKKKDCAIIYLKKMSNEYIGLDSFLLERVDSIVIIT